MNDQYQELATYYDEVVQERRDYQKIASNLSALIGERRNLLDIGIGTGLVVEHLLKSEFERDITGIDTSSSLLDLAKKKFGSRVDLHRQSVSDLKLNKIFDVAYSRGGAWTFIKVGQEVMLASHIRDIPEIQRSFYCIAQHLREGGLLIISSSNAYGNTTAELSNGVFHKRTVSTEQTADESYAILDYCFYKDEHLLAQQTLRLRLLSEREFIPMLEAAGLSQQGTSEDYCIYVKN